MRTIRFVPDAWEDYLYWQDQDKKTLKRINLLITAASREPFAGIGKPEPLRGDLSGYWSRRIDEANRLVYRATDTDLVIIACRFHY
ncbi:Txe/YoeB family addiction module toxin [Nitrosomonas sp. sh817]|uniref:Txe/YoeB family addiction module toxin n=1 Tax=Nitrosomonas sp. sh817 TaxID=3070658 RepID=UPI0027DE146E|nr:Txe/YoeB family addiction module toxin [Nitrosomonas sp. sh817]WMJ08576.1 Txe/YoeB family addiction module toxin [Nitrosomonas sp. sh817]